MSQVVQKTSSGIWNSRQKPQMRETVLVQQSRQRHQQHQVLMVPRRLPVYAAPPVTPLDGRLCTIIRTCLHLYQVDTVVFFVCFLGYYRFFLKFCWEERCNTCTQITWNLGACLLHCTIIDTVML